MFTDYHEKAAHTMLQADHFADARQSRLHNDRNPGADSQDGWSLTVWLHVPADRALPGEALSLGVPLPRGIVYSSGQLRMEAPEGLVSSQAWTPLEWWPDGSLRWILLEIWVSPRSRGKYRLMVSRTTAQHRLATATGNDREIAGAVDPCGHEMLRTVADDTGLAIATAGRTALPTIIDRTGPRLHADLVLRDQSGTPLTFYPEIPEPVSGISTGMPHWTHRGTLGSQGDPAALKLRTRTRLYAAGSTIRYEVQLHNPRRASHPGGCWDLGDRSSVQLSDIAVHLTLPAYPGENLPHGHTSSSPAHGSSLRLTPEAMWRPVDNVGTRLCQASSGGGNWQHVNHCDHRGKVNLPYRGYRLEQPNGKSETGLRASPTLHKTVGRAHLLVHLEHFWEGFPHALSTSDSGLIVGLFPAAAGQTMELQPGEKVTWVFWCVLDRSRNALDWLHAPAVMQLDRSAYAVSAGFRYPAAFLQNAERGNMTDAASRRFNRLLDAMLDGPSSFVAKRELIDEYGWRHFGDLYADHESWLKGTDLPSHYNNQYDPIMGMVRQYALRGDPRWLSLAGTMARHVMDIDIYDTEEDRAEYNGGLFWHTDHYQSAGTATHRTYSRNQTADYSTASRGGGPGTEHCYTTGLAYIYRMTGESDARAAVLQLTAWITRFQEGTGTLQECALKLLGPYRRHAQDLLRGRQVFRYRLSLDRGVGNYLTALLDSFELSGESGYLEQAGRVIADTFGPNDDIAARHLEDIESTWFYTIFLQAVVRFIDTKHAADEHDTDFWHARDALMHYGRWMLEHERPYLERADRLEYVNETWIAQDIRKADILYACYRFAYQDRTPLLDRARVFRDYVFRELGESPGAHYTRIYAILLQTPLGDTPLPSQPPLDLPPRPTGHRRKRHDGKLNWAVLVRHIATDIGRAIVRVSPSAEIRWIRARLLRSNP